MTVRTTMLMELFEDEMGQDLIEYAMLVSFVSITAILALQALGLLVPNLYQNLTEALRVLDALPVMS